jgi:hypothetical protein
MENYFLNLELMKSLTEKEQDIIHLYYKDMLYAFYDGRKEISKSYMLTLLNSKYLVDSRDHKINQILGENEL